MSSTIANVMILRLLNRSVFFYDHCFTHTHAYPLNVDPNFICLIFFVYIICTLTAVFDFAIRFDSITRTLIMRLSLRPFMCGTIRYVRSPRSQYLTYKFNIIIDVLWYCTQNIVNMFRRLLSARVLIVFIISHKI